MRRASMRSVRLTSNGTARMYPRKKMPPSQPPSVADSDHRCESCGSNDGTRAKPAIEQASAAQKVSTRAADERALRLTARRSPGPAGRAASAAGLARLPPRGSGRRA
jgi:hypothetical protein